MQQVDLVWSRPHYADHMLPIFLALPDEIRGEVRPRTFAPQTVNHIAMVASWDDVEYVRDTHRYFYVEHGAGQAYGGDEKSALQPGYSGSGGYRHYGCLGFICPSDTVAERWTTAPAMAVGCPKLDRFFAEPLRTEQNSLCIAWHWNAKISPEATSAYSHYRTALPAIVARFNAMGWKVYGHAHPRWEGEINCELEQAGMELTTAEYVLRSCSMLMMDNSSLMFEFAALDKPVMALNAPWYRRDVHHGLRFWDLIPGPQVSHPIELLTVDLNQAYLAMTHPAWSDFRRSKVERVYKYRDALCSQRAADFICKLLA